MVKIEDEDEATARIEAALYSAGRPLMIEELIKASGTESRTKTLNILNNIMKKTNSAFKAIEIAILPDSSYVFQLKPEYSATIRRYASKPILHKATLKTLSYIAYLQPISSKQLVETRFKKYFGIEGDADSLKQKLFKRVRKSPPITVQNTVKTPTPLA
jgi:segregation and condensation protein B